MVTTLPSTILPNSVHQSGHPASSLRFCAPRTAFSSIRQQRRQVRCQNQHSLHSKHSKHTSKPREQWSKAKQSRPALNAPVKEKQKAEIHRKPQPGEVDPKWQKFVVSTPLKVSQHNRGQRPTPQEDNKSAASKDETKPPSPSRERLDGEIHAGKLNKLIVAAASIENILALYAAHKDVFNTINLATAFYRMARKLKSLKPKWQIQPKKLALQKHPDMKDLTAALVGQVDECGLWGLTNICWAQASMELGPPELMHKIVQHISERSRADKQYLETKHLSVVVWGAAKQDCLTRDIWDQFSPDITASLSQYSLSALCNIIWACATQVFKDDTAFIAAAAEATIQQKINLQGQTLAVIAWSFAKLGYFEGRLWDALTSQGLACIPNLSGTDLSMYLWATCQRLKAQAAKTKLDLTQQNQTCAHKKSFISQGDRSTLLAALRNRLGQLLLEKKVTFRVLAMSMSALAGIGYYSGGLMDAAADHFVENMQRVKTQPMVSLVWACSTSRHYHPKLFQACAAKVLPALADPTHSPPFTPLTISILVCSFAAHTVEPEDEISQQMVKRLCDKALASLDTFGVQALTNTAWGFAVLGHLHAPFFHRLRSIAPTKLPLLKLEELSQLYQLELILRLEAPDLGLDNSHLTRYEDLFAALQANGELAGMARARWQQLKAPAYLATSAFQKDVSAATTVLSLGHIIELEFIEEEYTVDIAFPEARVVIEADGPLHFMRNVHRATGRTIVKRRSLQQLGWTVLSVPYFHWDYMDSFTMKMVYMEGCLGQVGIFTKPQPALPYAEPDDASSRLSQQEQETIAALVAQREQLGLLCRPFPAAVSTHDQDEAADQGDIDNQQPNDEAPRSQPQRLSVSQQQALLHKRTGKATRSRRELILQVAKNRKEAPSQRQGILDDLSASGS